MSGLVDEQKYIHEEKPNANVPAGPRRSRRLQGLGPIN